MPAVKKLHQESQNNTKPEYIFGHSCQTIAIVVNAASSFFALPLACRIHEGLVFSNRDQRTLLDKMVESVSTCQWWKEAVVYQVYPRSYADSNGDGVGDFPGLIGKLDYLRDLGVDALWLSPVCQTPNRDYGYDITDHLSINPAWFVEARSSRDNPKRSYYIWREGKDGHEPNNWQADFGGSVWTYNPATGDYYMGGFSPYQPDLNWANPEVRQKMYEIMRWWAALADPESILYWYRRLIALRKQNPALIHGEYEVRELGNEVYAYRRTLGVTVFTVVLNWSSVPAQATLPDDWVDSCKTLAVCNVKSALAPLPTLTLQPWEARMYRSW
jgi:glycosidase